MIDWNKPACKLPLTNNEWSTEQWLGVTIGGKYDIENSPEVVIGEGATSVVYEGHQRDVTDRKVAIKRFRTTFKSKNGWALESKILGKIVSNNVIKVFDVGNSPSPWIATELIQEALPLDQFADYYGLNTHERIVLLMGVCDGILDIHNVECVHADIKPNNILVSPRVDREILPTPKIVDVGIARLLNAPNGNLSGQGTPLYRSPEVEKGKPATAQSDIYAFGILLKTFVIKHLTPEDGELYMKGLMYLYEKFTARDRRKRWRSMKIIQNELYYIERNLKENSRRHSTERLTIEEFDDEEEKKKDRMYELDRQDAIEQNKLMIIRGRRGSRLKATRKEVTRKKATRKKATRKKATRKKAVRKKAKRKNLGRNVITRTNFNKTNSISDKTEHPETERKTSECNATLVTCKELTGEKLDNLIQRLTAYSDKRKR